MYPNPCFASGRTSTTNLLVVGTSCCRTRIGKYKTDNQKNAGGKECGARIISEIRMPHNEVPMAVPKLAAVKKSPFEKSVEEGEVRSIGLSNWYIKELTDFLPKVDVIPALVQNEIHPFYQDRDVVPFIQEMGIVVQAWFPFGGRGWTKSVLGHPELAKIAMAHGKTVAQIVLRWNLQRNVSAIPGSSNPAHIKENTEIFDLELSDSDMEAIAALDRHEKHEWY